MAERRSKMSGGCAMFVVCLSFLVDASIIVSTEPALMYDELEGDCVSFIQSGQSIDKASSILEAPEDSGNDTANKKSGNSTSDNLTAEVANLTKAIKDEEKKGDRRGDHSLRGKGKNTKAPNAEEVEELSKDKAAQQVIEEQVERAIEKTVQKAAEENRVATEQELNDAVETEMRHVWRALLRAGRYGTFDGDSVDRSLKEFFQSVAFFDWCLLLGAVLLYLYVARLMSTWSPEHRFTGSGIVIWLAMGAMYLGLIMLRSGVSEGVIWLEGYMLEIIFLIENMFVFHVIVKAFKTQRWIMAKALYIIVVAQLIFQFVFYMGLAAQLRKIGILPYILGLWLLYVGYESMKDEEHADHVHEALLKFCKMNLGDRLLIPEAGSSRKIPAGDVFAYNGDKICITNTGLLVFFLLAVDFMLEIDVTITKIETIHNPYIAFSSSAIATFAVPELFFFARDVFRRYRGLKYGIAVVLVLFGVEMLLHKVVVIPALASIGVLLGVMAVSICASEALGLGPGSAEAEEDAEQRQEMPSNDQEVTSPKYDVPSFN